MTDLTIIVRGDPAPQGSKKVWHGRLVESSRRVKPWRQDIATAAMVARANRHLAGPVAVEVTVFLPRPASHLGRSGNLRGDAPAYPVARLHGDADKHARALLDGLVDGGVLADDSLVVDLHVRKRWAQSGTLPGAIIAIREVL